MILRPYQTACMAASIDGWSSFRKQLAVLPTGAGKAVLMGKMAEAALPARTLMLCHREELVDQAILKLQAATGIFAQKEKAEHRASLSAQVVVASVQTMQGNRLGKWPQNHFGLVIADEAHHALANSWQRTLRHFDQHALVWGCTATPDRADRKNLGSYFQRVAYEISLFDLIHQGYLAPIKVKALPIKIDLSGVKKTAGDYNVNDLGAAIDPYLRVIARELAEHAPFRKTLIFLPLIETSKAFTKILKEEGISAAHVDGYSDDRKETLARFSAGEIDVLCNAMLLTEGYDEPSIDCVIVLRPTRSRGLYSQMVGRGTRIAPAKKDLLVLDFLWLHEKHDLIKPAHLVASSKEEAEDISEMVEQDADGQIEFDLEDIQSKAREQREAKLKRELEAKAKREARAVDAMEFAVSMNRPDLANPEPKHPWEADPATKGQLNYLKQFGVKPESVKNKGHASNLINLLQRRRNLKLATPRQIAILRQFGHPKPETVSLAEANIFLDQRLKKPHENQTTNSTNQGLDS